MVYDVCLKIKDLGCIYGSFIKSTQKSIHLSNALLTKTSGVSISYMKIEKKHVIMVTRVGIPSFESFTDEQLHRVMDLNVLEYTQAVQKILESRKKASVSKQTPKGKVDTKKAATQEKDWDQFEANKNLFGVEPKFNVAEYACDIDRTAPDYPMVEAQAQKIAKGLSSEGGHTKRKFDTSEDALYSSVQQTDKWSTSESEKGGFNNEKVSFMNEKTRSENEKQANGAEIHTGAEASTGLKEERKVPSENIVKEIEQSYIDFEKQGWNAIAKFLNKKKAISNEVEVAQTPQPSSPEQAQQTAQAPHKGKKDVEKGKGSEQEPEKMKRPKSGQNSKKQQRQAAAEMSQKFTTAAEIVDFITKNLKEAGHGDNKPNWGEAKGIKEGVEAHLRTLDSFEFPAAKLDEIQKVCSERRIYTSKAFK